MKVGQRVYDSWWPHRIGVIKRINKCSVWVYFDEERVIYDNAHCKFLRPQYGN